jgi:sulfur-oxidizing protein SoxA
MQRSIIAVLAVCLTLATGLVNAGPDEDIRAFQDYFKQAFPDVAFDDFGNGIYAIDSVRREAWMNFENFPPWEDTVEKGNKLFHTPFANGKGYADCFPDYKKGIKQNYPYFDTDKGEVVTMELAINLCREKHGEKPLKWKKGPIAAISGYLAYLSRGNPTNVVVPDDPRALKAWEEGKRFYYSKRGQLNFSCANCHIHSPGRMLRANLLSPALGQTSHFPVYRKKWSGLGTMHRRYGGCNKQVRAKDFKAQSREYRNLEYFHTAMSNGVPLNGPASRQ